MFGFLKNKKKAAVRLPFTTDVHSHVLPGIDDGSPDIATSVALVNELSDLGITRIVATPHVTHESFPNNRETISAAYDMLTEELKKKNIDVKLYYAAEHRMDEGFYELMSQQKLIFYPEKYCLIENSFVQQFPGIEEVLFQLRTEGVQPVLAHPERYLYYANRRGIYERLSQLGCLFQLNILSFSGYYGKPVQEQAMKLLDKDMVHFLATDIHHLKHIELLQEFLQSKQYAKIKDRFDYLYNDSLLNETE